MEIEKITGLVELEELEEESEVLDETVGGRHFGTIDQPMTSCFSRCAQFCEVCIED